jgi:CspA family cold shock protein
VKWFNSQKGYGFIQPQTGGKDVFVHISAVERAGLSGLNEGQVVEYEEVANKGKTSAENLQGSALIFGGALANQPLWLRCICQYRGLPGAVAASAERNNIGTDVILTKELKRLVRGSVVTKRIDALSPCCHMLPLLKCGRFNGLSTRSWLVNRWPPFCP